MIVYIHAVRIKLEIRLAPFSSFAHAGAYTSICVTMSSEQDSKTDGDLSGDDPDDYSRSEAYEDFRELIDDIRSKYTHLNPKDGRLFQHVRRNLSDLTFDETGQEFIRGGIVAIMAAWESYVHDLFKEAFNILLKVGSGENRSLEQLHQFWPNCRTIIQDEIKRRASAKGDRVEVVAYDLLCAAEKSPEKIWVQLLRTHCENVLEKKTLLPIFSSQTSDEWAMPIDELFRQLFKIGRKKSEISRLSISKILIEVGGFKYGIKVPAVGGAINCDVHLMCSQALVTETSDHSQVIATGTSTSPQAIATGTSTSPQAIATGTSTSPQAIATGTSTSPQAIATGTSTSPQAIATETSDRSQAIGSEKSDNSQAIEALCNISRLYYGLRCALVHGKHKKTLRGALKDFPNDIAGFSMPSKNDERVKEYYVKLYKRVAEYGRTAWVSYLDFVNLTRFYSSAAYFLMLSVARWFHNTDEFKCKVPMAIWSYDPDLPPKTPL